MAKTKCPVFYAFTQDGQCVPVWCGQWTCERCAKHNAQMWAWRARLEVDGQKHGTRYYFITLTLGSEFKSTTFGYAELPRIFNRIRMWVARAIAPDKWAYLAFVEGQPERKGMPHFHIISNISIASEATGKNAHGKRKRYGRRYAIRIKDWAVSRGLGFEAEESLIDGPRANNYVSKYASKGDARMPKGFRRARSSQSWAKLPPHVGAELIVRAWAEKTHEYLLRVEGITKIDIDTLYERYSLEVDKLTKKT